MGIQSATKKELLGVIENEGKVSVNSFVEGAIELAEEMHSDVLREDGKSSFLETHVWPVTIDVIQHYQKTNKLLTTLQVVSAILHDVMEDNDKILDLNASKAYGFDAYFKHRFGDYVYDIATTLKTKPLENYFGINNEERQTARFFEYCTKLTKSAYDVKIIKLSDRLNNMRFMSQIVKQKKVERYLRESEDFYIAFSILSPTVSEFYPKMRQAYDELKSIKVSV
ncbi:MAG: HD domain-containing protein [Nitrosopumilus sp.]|jgi:(p)ppGpp synthase/HD superfamily hydrolase|nr:HD domain-containing protein [Nitrosopumilus sp.]